MTQVNQKIRDYEVVFRHQATLESLFNRENSIAVLGLGYVGLPLAVYFSKHFNVIGLDISEKRIRELRAGSDRTGEVLPEELRTCKATFTSDPEELGRASIIVVAVPTPIDDHRNPDLKPLISASATVGRHMRAGCTVVYESTVYPSVTEDVCVPILERESGLKLGKDFSVGYSPERVNPGDRLHTVETIVKIVSGSDPSTTELLATLYGAITKAGTYKASSIKVAEAAKVIENTQRDLNIALMNELAIIFNRLGIDTLEVLEAAGTKWNFLPFRPGLVGGHCIGVDPYYLTHKAEETGYHPQVILAGRRINDGMGKYVAEQAVKLMIGADSHVHRARVGILGLSFKENVPDLRNTRVIDIVKELEEYSIEVLVHDPLANPEEALLEYGLKLSPIEDFRKLDAVILAVAHSAFKSLTLEAMASWYLRPGKPVLLDVKGMWNPAEAPKVGYSYWRL
ncbi:nucleotide sugar dehydrogenase [Desulfocurvibacter africanus]|uniref:nucleotide sugar dehydrogenase n=1 Tax=Desulfocurvibacter africanus TaxID=873 RepID=UPI0009DC34CA|nr:nucleotide sugar dehydrogenase [Desulfocurvibacter africanus]